MLPLRSVLLSCAIAMLSPQVWAQTVAVPAPATAAPVPASPDTPIQPPAIPQVAHTGTAVPLLSVDTLRFLEGDWSATSRDGLTALGSYRFVRELNGHVLARKSDVVAACDATLPSICARHDIFYVFQDSPGAPLKAISFDSNGRVVHYLTDISIVAAVSNQGRRDIVVFTSDPTQLGPRLRLSYTHYVDTTTGKDSMSGSFDLLMPDGQWRPLQQWWGTRL